MEITYSVLGCPKHWSVVPTRTQALFFARYKSLGTRLPLALAEQGGRKLFERDWALYTKLSSYFSSSLLCRGFFVEGARLIRVRRRRCTSNSGNEAHAGLLKRAENDGSLPELNARLQQRSPCGGESFTSVKKPLVLVYFREENILFKTWDLSQFVMRLLNHLTFLFQNTLKFQAFHCHYHTTIILA